MAYNAELQMTREFVWFLCTALELKCCFCQKPLIEPREGMTWGHRRHPAIPIALTLHHIDFDRTHNEPTNIGVCHQHCHKKYHKEVNIANSSGKVISITVSRTFPQLARGGSA